MNDTSYKQWLEAQYQVVEVINHLNEKWKQRLTLDNLRLIERYLKGELQLLIEFSIRGIGEKFCAYLQGAMPVTGIHPNWCPFKTAQTAKDRIVLKCFGCHSSDIESPVSRGNGHEQAVLIDIVKLVQPPERIVPAFVWVDSVDSVNSRLRHALYFSASRSFVFRGIVRVDDWKADVPDFSDGQGHTSGIHKASDPDQAVGQVVKGASQIMKNVPCDSRNRGRDRLNAEHVISPPSCIRIMLASDDIGIGVGIKKHSRSVIEVIDVLFGPFNFQPNQSESLVSGHGWDSGVAAQKVGSMPSSKMD
jgi:hypothetical protein